MKKRVFILISMLFFVTYYNILDNFADSIEKDFKDICNSINVEQVSFLDAKEPDWNKWQKEAAMWISQLQKLSDKEPDSIWADDAQYLKARLSNSSEETWIKEFEYLLKRYPECNFEEWTKNAVPLLIPQHIPGYIEIRTELISSYKSIGSNEKAKQMYEKCLQEYARYKKFFDFCYKISDFSEENIIDLPDEEFKALENSVGYLDTYYNETEQKARDNVEKELGHVSQREENGVTSP